MLYLSFSFQGNTSPAFQDALQVFKDNGFSCDGEEIQAQLLSALKLEHWPLEDNSVSQVELKFVLERLNDFELLHVLNELNRVCCDGALITIVASHPGKLPADFAQHAHGLNDVKFKLLDASIREANSNLLSNYDTVALEQNPLQLNWENMGLELQLTVPFISKLKENQVTEQQQVLNQVLQDPDSITGAVISMIVHKEAGHNFGLAHLGKAPKFVMRLYPLENQSQFVSRLIKTSGCFEVEETLVVHSLLQSVFKHKSSAKLANIGANLGWYSLFNALVFPELKVDAFEPTPKTVELFKHSIALNNLEERITVFPIALSDSKGTCQLFLDSNNAGSNSLMEAQGNFHHIEKAIEIATDSLDNIYLGQPKEAWPDVIVMDVEGHEQKVLDGAKGMFAHESEGKKWRPAIATEFSPSLMCLRGECTFFKDLVEQHDYKAYIISRQNLREIQPISVDELQNIYNELKENNPNDQHIDLLMLPSEFQL